MTALHSRPTKVLFAQLRWWFPTALSGIDIANHEMACRLSERGFAVRVLCTALPGAGDHVEVKRYRDGTVPVCLVRGDFSSWLLREIEADRPDVVFTSCPRPGASTAEAEAMISLLRTRGVPIVLYAHDLLNTVPFFESSKDAFAEVVANSHFTAERIGQLWSRTCSVVYPVPDWSAVDAEGISGPYITFFNPSPIKGLGIAHALVTHRFPERPFLFVEGFIDHAAHGISLVRSGNLVHAHSSPDVASIYMMTRTVIVPSQWEEPFGRIALEAMYNKIPVIASRTGGLLESVGEGGVLIDDYDNVEVWAEAIAELDDPSRRRLAIEAGTMHLQRFSASRETDTLADVLNHVARDSAFR